MAKGYKDVLSDYGDKIVSRIQQGLISDDTMATGEAYRSVRAIASEKQLRITYNKSVAAVDRGLRPGEHSPNWQSIVRWMQAKGIQPRAKGRFVNSTPSNYKRSAFAIGKAIYRNGTIKRFTYRGTGVLDRAWSRGLKSALTKSLRKRTKENIKAEMAVILKQNGFTRK
jgi:hypothetical protein